MILRAVSPHIGLLIGLSSLHFGAYTLGQVVVYEGTVFPENDMAPWARIMQGPPVQRWIDGSSFNQAIGSNEFDGYNRPISEFVGSRTFFLTWREASDFPNLNGAANPNGISAASSTNDLFAFKISATQVEFIRDNPISLVVDVNITPGAFHTYYLGLNNRDRSYSWAIDGLVVNTGTFPIAYPPQSGLIQWFARCFANQEQNAKWDYIRYGVIPADYSGDFDSNGVVDQTDLYFFVDCLLGPDHDAAGPGCKWADMNGDGKADGADIALFVRVMLPA